MVEINGDPITGVEHGNAWSVQPGPDKNGWLVGFSDHLKATPLRFMPKTTKASVICIKWFEHKTTDDKKNGKNKDPSSGRTMSFLVNDNGRFKISFWKDESAKRMEVTLTEPGDFAVWGAGLNHEWEPLADSTVITVRWTPESTPTDESAANNPD